VLKNLFVSGLDYKHADLPVRSLYSMDDLQLERFYQLAGERGIGPVVVLSTCNRTELYSTGLPSDVEALFCEVTGADYTHWTSVRSLKKGREAVTHLFKVAAGLDSQILGDNEILGQVRTSFKKAKRFGLLDGFLERVINTSIQAAKDVRTQTKISDGTVSASYAAVKLLKRRGVPSGTRVLLIGTGSFGRSLARNLRSYFPGIELGLSNRTVDRAEELAGELGAGVVAFPGVAQEVGAWDIVFTTVGGVKDGYLLTAGDFSGGKTKLVIDMSVPCAVAPWEAGDGMPEQWTIDDISGLVKDTITYRASFLPVAERILVGHVEEFCRWAALYEQKDAIREMRDTLFELSKQCPFWSQWQMGERDKMIQLTVADFAKYLKRQPVKAAGRQRLVEEFLSLRQS
jgi:glutamyl-tRNA reductase